MTQARAKDSETSHGTSETSELKVSDCREARNKVHHRLKSHGINCRETSQLTALVVNYSVEKPVNRFNNWIVEVVFVVLCRFNPKLCNATQALNDSRNRVGLVVVYLCRNDSQFSLLRRAAWTISRTLQTRPARRSVVPALRQLRIPRVVPVQEFDQLRGRGVDGGVP